MKLRNGQVNSLESTIYFAGDGTEMNERYMIDKEKVNEDSAIEGIHQNANFFLQFYDPPKLFCQ